MTPAADNGITQMSGQDDDSLVEALLSASRALVAVAARSLAAHDPDVTLVEYRALVLLGSLGPQRVRRLASQLGVHTPIATSVCDRLQHRGLIHPHRPAGDPLSVRVALTDAGAELVRLTTHARRTEIAQILTEMPPWARGQMVAGLRAFADAAGEVLEQDWVMGWDDPPPRSEPARGCATGTDPTTTEQRPTTRRRP